MKIIFLMEFTELSNVGGKTRGHEFGVWGRKECTTWSNTVIQKRRNQLEFYLIAGWICISSVQCFHHVLRVFSLNTITQWQINPGN